MRWIELFQLLTDVLCSHRVKLLEMRVNISARMLRNLFFTEKYFRRNDTLLWDLIYLNGLYLLLELTLRSVDKLDVLL